MRYESLTPLKKKATGPCFEVSPGDPAAWNGLLQGCNAMHVISCHQGVRPSILLAPNHEIDVLGIGYRGTYVRLS